MGWDKCCQCHEEKADVFLHSSDDFMCRSCAKYNDDCLILEVMPEWEKFIKDRADQAEQLTSHGLHVNLPHSVFDVLSASRAPGCDFALAFQANLASVFRYDKTDIIEFLTTITFSELTAREQLLDTRLKIVSMLQRSFPGEFENKEMYNRRKLGALADDIYTIGYCVLNNVKDKRLLKVFKGSVSPTDALSMLSHPTDSTNAVLPTAPPLEQSQSITEHEEVSSCASSNDGFVTPPEPTAPKDTLITHTDIQAVLQGMVRLTNEVNQLARKLDNVTEENSRLTRENASLKNDIADLTMKVSELTWKSFSSPTETQDLLIGSSLIRDIDPDKLRDTTVICKPGGTINTIKDVMLKLDRDYNNITIVVGGNDCSNQPDVEPAEIVSKYDELTQLSLSRCNKLTVSSICPRLSSDIIQMQIDRVNASLFSMCKEKDNVRYADNTPHFKLGDGSINDGYYHPDGVHITRAGVNKLAKNLKLRIQDEAEGVCKDRKRLPTKYAKPAGTSLVQDTSEQPDDHYGRHPADNNEGWQTQKKYQRRHARRQGHNTDRRHSRPSHDDGDYDEHMSNERTPCYNCGEVNHNRGRCRYSYRIECRTCGEEGHKSKHHEDHQR